MPDALHRLAAALRSALAAVPRALWWIVALAAGLRLLLLAAALLINGGAEVLQVPDTLGYLRPAVELLRTGAYATSAGAEIERTPGYSLLMLPGWVLGPWELVTALLQIGIGTGIVGVLYGIVRDMGGDRRMGLLAAALYALEPLAVMHAVLLLSETLFTALVLLHLWSLVRYLRGGAAGWLAVAAAMLAASVYVRPVAYYLPVPVALGILGWWLLQRRLRWRHGLHAAAFLACCVVLIGVWQVRNRIQTGYGGFSSVSAIGLYHFSAGALAAEEQGLSLAEYVASSGYNDDAAYLRQNPEQRGWSRAQRLAWMQQDATARIAAHPLSYLRNCLRGLLNTLRNPGMSDWHRLLGAGPGLVPSEANRWGQDMLPQSADLLRNQPGWAVVAGLLALWLLVYYAGWAIALLNARELRPWLVVLTLLAAYFVIAVSAGGGGTSRYRHPVMPLLAICAGVGYGQLARQRHGERPA